ncbi:MAG: YkgJ family cysteine cluster protein [Cyanobium sp.]
MKPQNQWQCISGCGACCRLDPALRGEALDALDPQQRQTYLAMVGADGWCIHFDTGSRRCKIYAQRPDFCRVENLVGLFSAGGCGSAESPTAAADNSAKAAPSGLGLVGQPDELAIACCRQQIRSEWGGRGNVMKRFNRAIRQAIRHRR